MSYKAVIFDQDGVLVNLQYFISAVDAALINHTLQGFSGERDREFVTSDDIHHDAKISGASFAHKLYSVAGRNDLLAIRGDAQNDMVQERRILRRQLLDELLEKGADIVSTFQAAQREVVETVVQTLRRSGQMVDDVVTVNAFPGVIETVQSLAENGVKIGVASSNTTRRVQIVLRRAGLNYFGDNVCGVDGLNDRHKPAPDVYLKAAQKLNVQPSECIVVEDSESGILSAKNAGMFVFGVAQDPLKKFDAEEAIMLKHGVRIICRDFAEVRAHLAEALELPNLAAKTNRQAPGLSSTQG